jgi:outer membrane protein TolC
VTHLPAVLIALTASAALAGEGPPGEGPAPLALEECVRLAASAPSSVSVALEQGRIAEAGFAAARAGLLPQASLMGSYLYNSPQRGVPDLQSFASLDGIDHYIALLNVTEELDISGRLRAGLTRARAEQDAATALHRLSRRDLRRAVARAYFAALLSRKLVAVAKDGLAEARWFEDRTRRLSEQGEAARADVVQASAQVASLEQDVREAELGVKLATQELASFWTTDVSTPLYLVDVLEGPEPDAPEKAIPDPGWMEARPENALLDAQRRSLLAEARGARAERLPQASVTFQYGVDSLRPQIADRGYAFFANLAIPLFDGSRASSTSKQLEAEAGQIAARQEIQRRTFALEYESARARVESLRAQLAGARSKVALLEESLRLSRLRYEGGEGAALEVVAAQALLTRARADYYRAKADAWNASEDLRAATGEGGVASE